MPMYNVEAYSLPDESKGLRASTDIRKGDVIWREPRDDPLEEQSIPRPLAYIEALPEAQQRIFRHFMYKTGSDMYESLPEFDKLPLDEWPRVVVSDISMFMNHSCDPTVLFAVTEEAYMQVAARDLPAGSPITFDYASSNDYDETFECACGAERCRGTITADDWRRPALQTLYGGHFLPHIQEKIDASLGVLRAHPPFGAHAASQCGGADRWRGAPAAAALYAPSPTGGPDLVAANRDALALVRRHGIKVCETAALGFHLVATGALPTGAVAMLLPPNRLVTFSTATVRGLNFNQALQVRPAGSLGRGGADGLFSFSLTKADLDNFIAHSCEPAFEVRVDPVDLSVRVVARRDLPPGTTIAIDYEITEEDMVAQGVAFDCACGAPTCRGHIVGHQRRAFMHRKPSVAFEGETIAVLGYGSIAQGLMPLLTSQRHVAFRSPRQLLVFAQEAEREGVQAGAARYGFRVAFGTLDEASLSSQLAVLGLCAGDLLLNLTCDVDTIALMGWCQPRGVLYVDTTPEAWLSCPPAERSTYEMRMRTLRLRRECGPCAPTALSSHGANPGVVSHFVKVAMLRLARERGLVDGDIADADTGGGASSLIPSSRVEWARLARQSGVRLIQISEYDSQRADDVADDEFVCSWSPEAMIAEACQPAELGYGTHETTIPRLGVPYPYEDVGDLRRVSGGLMLTSVGGATLVRSWTPLRGSFMGFLGSHAESFSIASYFSLTQFEVNADECTVELPAPEAFPAAATPVPTPVVTDGDVAYRPTVHFAYRPCEAAFHGIIRHLPTAFANVTRMQLLTPDEIYEGEDELGVLLCGVQPVVGRPFAYWLGSQLKASVASALVEGNQATTLQVTSSVIAGIEWVLRSPAAGVVEPDEIDHISVLEACAPYLAPIVGVHTDWMPLGEGKEHWQFSHILE